MGAQEPDPATNARYVTLAYLCGLTLILYLDRMCIGKAAPFIQDELGLLDWQMGFVHAAFMLAYGLFEVVTGHWGDRFGSRRVLIRIVVWWSIFTALTGAVTGFVMLLVVRFLFGAGEAGALPNVSRVVDHWFPPSARGRVRGFVHTPALVGGMVAPLVTAYLIELIGWRWVFVAFGSVGVAWALLFSRWFRDAPTDHPAVNAAERALIGPPPTAAHAGHLPVRPILASRNVWLLCGVLASGSCCVYLMFAWYPTYLEKVRGVSNVESGWWNSLIMLGGAVGCLAGGWFADLARRRVPNRRWTFPVVGGPAFALAAVALGAGSFASAVEWKSAFLAVACFGIHCHAGSWWGANSAMSAPHTAAVFGVINSFGVLSAAGAQIAFGAVSRAYWDGAFLVSAGLLAVGAVCWLSVDVRKPVFPAERPGVQPE
ncbi:MFS transporter [Gemmata sp. G18]|uniref:MFS transporter n=1 Tax=Gemmata palustris TaxID=2822762 RepID=A0ABS5BRC7_9BACT|nr:MFS transporter [Gemmata palustris]MBP3955962.1 MFS transporter [Gemmata palustris]